MYDYLSPEAVAAGFPDLRAQFKNAKWRMMPHSPHAIGSDFQDYPADDPVFGLYRNSCGFQTRDEVAILWQWAQRWTHGSKFADIGCHTGWVTAHIAKANRDALVYSVDPMLENRAFEFRLFENVGEKAIAYNGTAEKFFQYIQECQIKLSGVSIDGDHDRPAPLFDASCALLALDKTGFIALHDAWGAPVYEACSWLLDQPGIKGRFYDTPHGYFVAWRGDCEPVSHTPDPSLQNWFAEKRIQTKFPFRKCS